MKDDQHWVKRVFTVYLDEGTYGDSPDEEEIAYLLRMGGIGAETVASHERSHKEIEA